MGTTRKRAVEAAPEAGGSRRVAKRGKAPVGAVAAAKAQVPAQRTRSKSGTAATGSKGSLARSKTAEQAPKQSKGKSRSSAAGSPSKSRRATGRSADTGVVPSSAAAPASLGRSAPIRINRAPVLTLWAAVVAQRQGLSWREALTFGKAVSGILAQSKGRSLGIYEEREHSGEEQAEQARAEAEAGVQRVDVFGMRLKAVASPAGERLAYSGGTAVNPSTVQGYLSRSFGDRLVEAKATIEALAAAVSARQLGRVCYNLYERFRPEWKGWGVPGELDLQRVADLANTWQQERQG